jgi:hypothetical protein
MSRLGSQKSRLTVHSTPTRCTLLKAKQFLISSQKKKKYPNYAVRYCRQKLRKKGVHA